ncbi:hypothetical protein [Herbaspirillum seropedicae]|uniref:hypothetical protein n=1 Tax=Herbaspirillum seropedicae TaxID=964 RepID=UPI003D97A095
MRVYQFRHVGLLPMRSNCIASRRLNSKGKLSCCHLFLSFFLFPESQTHFPEAAWASYQLTTIRQDVARLVQETCALLIEQMEQGGRAPVVRKLAVELVKRATVRG